MIIKCKQCKKEFKSRYSTRQFCSWECFARWQVKHDPLWRGKDATAMAQRQGSRSIAGKEFWAKFRGE